jgi:hypothetical protein
MTTTLSVHALTRLAVSLLCAGLLFDCTANAITVVEGEVDSDCGGSGTCNASHSCVATLPDAGADLAYGQGADDCQADSAVCETCMVQNCTAVELATCISDAQCRRVIDSYAQCLGADCTGTLQQCFEPLFDVGSVVPICITKCISECSHAPIYSNCDLYCGCMLSNCSSKFDTVAECVSDCKTLLPDVVTCRRTHCEIAPRDPTLPHCDHAVGIQTCLSSVVQTRPVDCQDKSLTGYYCQVDSDCCSNACDLTKKACANP